MRSALLVVVVALTLTLLVLAPPHVHAQCGSCPTTSVPTDAADACSYDLNTLITNLAQENEGCTLGSYVDTTGHATVGYGFNLVQSGAANILSQAGVTNVSVSDLINGACLTPSQATAILTVELGMAQQCAEGLLSNFSSLPVTAQAVAIDMSFNLGCGGFGSFSETLSAINSYNWSGAVSGMQNSLWCSQVGTRCTRDSALMSDSGSSYCSGGSGGGSTGGSCSAGTYLDSDGVDCDQCSTDPNCASVSSYCSGGATQNGCASCSTGYYVDNDGVTCDACTTDPNCASVSSDCSGGATQNGCASCSSGYYVDSDGVTCDACSSDPNCASVAPCSGGATTSECNVCNDGYYLGQQAINCYACSTDPNCVSAGACSNGALANPCNQCADGYVVDQDGFTCDAVSSDQQVVSNKNANGGVSTTTIALATVFSVVGAALIAVAVVVMVRRRRAARTPAPTQMIADSASVYARMEA